MLRLRSAELRSASEMRSSKSPCERGGRGLRSSSPTARREEATSFDPHLCARDRVVLAQPRAAAAAAVRAAEPRARLALAQVHVLRGLHHDALARVRARVAPAGAREGPELDPRRARPRRASAALGAAERVDGPHRLARVRREDLREQVLDAPERGGRAGLSASASSPRERMRARESGRRLTRAARSTCEGGRRAR